MPHSLDYHASPLRSRVWRCLGSRFSRWHAWVAGVLWVVFSVLTLLIVLSGLDHATGRPLTVAATTAGTCLGPMTGAISRDFQGCCLKFSLSLLPWCGGALLAGTAVQWFVPPKGWFSRSLRVVAWLVALLAWFGGGLFSFAHALS